jgi:hypothetical protein
MGTGFFPGVKMPGLGVDHSPPPSTVVKNAWVYSPAPLYIFMVWYLIKQRDNFNFTFCIKYGRVSTTVTIATKKAQRLQFLTHWFIVDSITVVIHIQTYTKHNVALNKLQVLLSLKCLQRLARNNNKLIIIQSDHSPPSITVFKNAWSYTSTPPICLHGVVLS